MKTAEHYVKVYVEHHAQAADNSELAVLGPNLAGLLVDFRGEIPTSSGYKCDTVGWRAERLRRIHPDYVQALSLLAALTPAQRTAAVQWAYCRDRRPEKCKQRLISKKMVAEWLGLDYETFRRHVSDAHRVIEAIIFDVGQ